MTDFSRGQGNSEQEPSRMMRRSNSAFIGTERDPKFLLLQDLKLPFVATAAAIQPIASEIKDLPKMANCEMWNTEQLYSLKSELIQLKAFLDRQEAKCNEVYSSFTRIMANSFVEKPMDREPRRIRLNKIDNSKLKEQDNKNSDKLPPGVKSTDRKQLSSKNHSKHKEKEFDPNEPKEITPDTIWETTDRFFKPIKTPNYFDRYLTPSKPMYDLSKIQEPLGPHYSLTFPKTPQYLSDPLKAKLKMPSPPFASSETGEMNVHIHRRLISALINMDDIEDTASDSDFTEPRSEGEEVQKKRKFTASTIRKTEDYCVPRASRIGSSAYGQLSFETRLKLELQSVGITSEGKAVQDMNYPVVHYLNEAVAQQRSACETANYWRRQMERYIIEGQKIFQDNVRRNKNWNNALSLYLQQEEILKNAKKNKARNKAKENKKSKEVESSNSSTPSELTSDIDDDEE